MLGEGTGNNYAYLVTDDKSKESVIIDPANPPECVSNSVEEKRELILSQGSTRSEGAD